MIAGAGAPTQSGRLTGMDRLMRVQRNAQGTKARCVGAIGLFLRGKRGYERHISLTVGVLMFCFGALRLGIPLAKGAIYFMCFGWSSLRVGSILCSSRSHVNLVCKWKHGAA